MNLSSTMESVFSKCACFTSDEIHNGSRHFLACAPCPPPLFEYSKFVSFASEQNLSSCEIDEIAIKCRLEPPIVLENISSIPVDNVTVDNFEDTEKELKTWVIPFIVVSSFIAVTALMLLTVIIRHRNRVNEDNTEKKSKQEHNNQHEQQQQQMEKKDTKSHENGTGGILNPAYSNFDGVNHKRDMIAVDNEKENKDKKDILSNISVDIDYCKLQKQTGQSITSTTDTTGDNPSEERNPNGECI